MAVAIPRWFVWFLSGIIGLAAPWVLWVSHTLIRIDERSQLYHDGVTNASTAVSNLERQLQQHLSDPSPHAAALRDLQRQIDATTSRIDRVEKAMVKP